mmetsp:Transcript_35535/g.87394  ORF Transcript_35535/g.87394 Transcript_35535/m.87394 type:complete len:365 (-) Transcript_35535:112-1206(-)
MAAAWRAAVLVVACVFVALLRGSGVEGVQVISRPLDAPTTTPLFAGGKDVFGRTPRCRTCHMVVNSINQRLVPALLKMKAKEEKRFARGDAASRRIDYGVYTETVEQFINNACTTQDLFHIKTVRRNCQEMMEEHEEEVNAVYSRWIKKGAPDFHQGAASGWSWNWEVCYKATQSCSEELAMHALEEFDDDGSGASERKYRSEPVPSVGTKRDGLYQVVAGSFFDVLVKDDAVDTLAYVGFPNKGRFHGHIMPALAKVQELFEQNATLRGTVMVGMVDAEMNDVPPPYGTDTKTPTLCLYPAGNKGWPRYISDLNDGQLTVYDVLFFMKNTSSQRTARVAMAFMLELPDHVLHSKVWDSEDGEL